MRRLLPYLFAVLIFACNSPGDTPTDEVTLVPYDSAMMPMALDTVVVMPRPEPEAEADTSLTAIEELAKEESQEARQVKDILKLLSPMKLFSALLVFVIGFVLIRFISQIMERIAEKSVQYRITIKSFIPVVRVFGWVFVIVIIIGGVFHPPIQTVIAVSASTAIAVGFAAQDILKNMFGGIMILFDRPFQVGDKIQVGDYYGEVVEIGLRSTRIVTPGDSLVSVPNAEIMNQSVSNANNGEANCQVQADIFLPITADTQRIRQVAIEAAQVSRFIFLNKPIAVLFNNVMTEERSMLKMSVKAYVADIRNEMAFKSDMTEIIMRELLKQHLIDPRDL